MRHKALRILYRWLEEEDEIDQNPHGHGQAAHGESAAVCLDQGSFSGRGRPTVGALRLSWLEVGVTNDYFPVHAAGPPTATPC